MLFTSVHYTVIHRYNSKPNVNPYLMSWGFFFQLKKMMSSKAKSKGSSIFTKTKN